MDSNQKIERIANWARGGTDLPVTLELNPTNRCNLLCRSCWQREFEINDDELNSNRLLEVVKQAAGLGVKEIRVPGAGEPLLRRDLPDILCEIKRIHANIFRHGYY